MTLVVEEDLEGALRLVAEVMGEYHGYYAFWSREAGASGLVARVDGRVAGATVYYKAGLDGLGLGVIYYVVVKPGYRGRGLGRILVASSEELMGPVDAYVATTTSDNRSSMRMFESLGYRALRLYELEDELGVMAYDLIVYATCLYEEDLVLLKDVSRDWYERITHEHLRAAYRIWERICYEPWLRRRAKLSLLRAGRRGGQTTLI